jgi:hypothetical protein
MTTMFDFCRHTLLPAVCSVAYITTGTAIFSGEIFFANIVSQMALLMLAAILLSTVIGLDCLKHLDEIWKVAITTFLPAFLCIGILYVFSDEDASYKLLQEKTLREYIIFGSIAGTMGIFAFAFMSLFKPKTKHQV